MKRFLTIGVLVGGVANAAPNIGTFQAAEIGNNLLINSPYGTKVFFGDLGLKDLSSYKISIPLADLRNNPQKLDVPGGADNFGKSEAGSPEALQAEEAGLLAQANELYNDGKFMDALKYVDEVLRRNKDSTKAWVMKGSLLHAMGQKDSARAAWQEAQTRDPENKEIKSILESYQ